MDLNATVKAEIQLCTHDLGITPLRLKKNYMLREAAPSAGIVSAEARAQQCNGCMVPSPGYQAGEKCPFRKDL